MQDVAERVICHMWNHYPEPISLADMAGVAILSPFHFSRVFRDTTGVSPGRFLSTIRLYEAKRMLVTTSYSVTDIAFAVGYCSLGTFTRRFTQSVGISPARFRRITGATEPKFPKPVRQRVRDAGTIIGRMTLPAKDQAHRVYLGAFDTPIVRGVPVACDVLDAEGRYRLDALPPGEWYVQAIGTTAHAGSQPWIGRCACVGITGPVKVLAGETVEIDMEMRPRRISDLPVLLMLPDLDSRARPEPAMLMKKFA